MSSFGEGGAVLFVDKIRRQRESAFPDWTNLYYNSLYLDQVYLSKLLLDPVFLGHLACDLHFDVGKM